MLRRGYETSRAPGCQCRLKIGPAACFASKACWFRPASLYQRRPSCRRHCRGRPGGPEARMTVLSLLEEAPARSVSFRRFGRTSSSLRSYGIVPVRRLAVAAGY